MSLIEDSELIRSMLENGDDINEIYEIISTTGKANLDLVFYFYNSYPSSYVNSSSLTLDETNLRELFLSMDYLMCGRIKELYCLVFDNNKLFLELHEYLQRDIFNYCYKYIQIDSGVNHTIVLMGNGSVDTFGSDRGCVSDDLLEKKIKFIAAGSYHSVGIERDGTIFAWGNNKHGQCDNIPQGRFKYVAAGDRHSVGIRDEPGSELDDTLAVWGNNTYHQCDNVPSGKFKYVYCGSNHSVGLREDGTIAAWGDDRFGQCSGAPSYKFKMVRTSGKLNIGIIDSNDSNLDSRVVIWGTFSLNKIPCSFTERFKYADCSFDHFTLMREDGAVITIGSDTYNEEIGFSGDFSVYEPEGRFKEIKCISSYTVGSRDTGEMVVWGAIRRVPNYHFSGVDLISGDNNSLLGVSTDGRIINWHDYSAIPHDLLKFEEYISFITEKMRK